MTGTLLRVDDAFDQVLAAAPTVGLEGLDDGAALMTRREHKYFAPPDVIARILARAGMRVLEIDGRRRHRYSSLYFDTPDLLFLRQHVQERRGRAKVRIRTYDSGEAFLEVKAKGARGETVKERMALPMGPVLDEQGRDFLRQHVPGAAEDLVPVLETRYERVTFAGGGVRVTCDLDLGFQTPGGRSRRGPGEILVETKSAAGRSAVDRALWARGVRPVSMSKYGVGLSLLDGRVPANRWNRVLRRYFGQGTCRPGGVAVPFRNDC